MEDKICRLCCINIGKYFIFSKSDEKIQRSTKIMHCTNLIVIEDDGLPSLVCTDCDKKVSQFYDFARKCEEADKKLRLIRQCKIELSCDEIKIEAFEKNENNLLIKSETDSDTFIDEYIHNSDVSKEYVHLSNESQKKLLVSKRKFKHRVRKSSGKSLCSVCGRNCQNPSTLKIHMRSHSNEKPFSCESCDKKYKDSGGLKRHTERNHYEDRPRNFICDNCGKTFYSKTDVQIHMRTHTGETPYTCSSCPKTFTQLGSKIRHEMRHTGKKTETCLTCHKLFYTKQDLINHSVVHTSEKKYLCPICSSWFKYKNNLLKHQKQHLDPDKFVCDYCGCTFNLKGNLKVHISRKHSLESGFCKICTKDVPNIKMHSLVHAGERPEKCEYCAKSYSTKNGLAHHVNFRHKFPDKYKCEIKSCHLSFPSQPMLAFHVAKLHGTSIPFTCDRCNRGFYRKSDLSRHKLGTHKERLTI